MKEKEKKKGDMTDENETWDRKNVLSDAASSSGTKQGE
jgi:hypothetical protein